MKDEELIPALQEGGPAREKALALIFKHKVIRNSVLKRLQPFQERLRNHFPRTERGFLFRKRSREENYVNHFFIEAIIELEKKVRNDTLRGKSFGELHNFLVSTSRFKCIDWLRRLKPTEQISSAEETGEDGDDNPNTTQLTASQNIEEAHLNQARKERLLKLLNQLSKSCQSILLLVAQGYKNDEIARKLDHTKNSVKTLKSTCRKKLKRLIDKDDELLDLFSDFL